MKSFIKRNLHIIIPTLCLIFGHRADDEIRADKEDEHHAEDDKAYEIRIQPSFFNSFHPASL